MKRMPIYGHSAYAADVLWSRHNPSPNTGASGYTP